MATKWPSVYWNTANLIVDSGGDAGDGVDYGKIAKSIGTFTRRGVRVELPSINNSDIQFIPVESENKILYGLNAISGISPQLIEMIKLNRPYLSFDDLMSKIKLTKIQKLSLVKSGCLDEFGDRGEMLMKCFADGAELKTKLTLQNLPKLLETNSLPDEVDWLKRLAKFNLYLRKFQEIKVDGLKAYRIDGPYEVFFNEFLDESILNYDSIGLFVFHSVWDKEYKKLIAPLKTYIANNQQDILKTFNGSLLGAEKAKYQDGHGTFAEMEIASCGFFSSEDHWLFKHDLSKYGIDSFSTLPEQPIYQKMFTSKQGKDVYLPTTTRITGIVVHKIPDKGLVYILDKQGIVEVKMPKQLCAHYDRKISDVVDGKKIVVQDSFFVRGSVLVVSGYRDHDQFVCRKYGKTGGHHLNKILDIRDNKLYFEAERV